MNWKPSFALGAAVALSACGSATTGSSGSGKDGGTLECTSCAKDTDGGLTVGFGSVLLNKVGTQRVTFRNGSRGQVTFSMPRPEEPFACSTCGERTLDPGSSTTFSVTFAPTASQGEGATSQVLDLEWPGNRTVPLRLEGESFRHFLAFDGPGECFDFGSSPGGASKSASFTVRNRADRAVRILSVDTTGGGVFTVDRAGLTELAPAGQPGDSADLQVTWTAPEKPGSHEGLLRVLADADAGGLLQQCLRAASAPPGACTAELDPPDGKLTLGPATPASSVTVPFSVRATGDGPCQVGPITLRRLAGDAFSVNPDTEQTVTVAPGERRTVPVRFSPAVVGTYADSIVVKVEGLPDRAVELRGISAVPCLRFASSLDFGVVGPSCESRVRTLELENRCASTVTLERLTATAPFRVEGPDLPLVISPSSYAEVEVAFRSPDAPAVVEGELQIVTSELPDPWRVTLTGEVAGVPHQVDTFTQQGRPEQDVLLVLDTDIGDRLVPDGVRDAFLALAVERDLDFHLGVTRSNVGDGCAADGRLLPLSGDRFLTADTAGALWASRVSSADPCDVGPDQPLETARRALTSPVIDRVDDPRHAEPADGNLGLLRRGAPLAVVIATARDDASPEEVPRYLADLRSTKSPRLAGFVSVHALFRPPGAPCSGEEEEGTRLAQAIQQSGGTGASVCALDVADAMESLGRAVFASEQCYELTGRPTGSGATDGWFQVLVDGRAIPPLGPKNERRWNWRPGANALCFTIDGAPPPGAEIRIDYAVACAP